MEATLVLITLISIAAAIGLSVMGWSLLRNDRRRSDARVATLEALAFDEPVAPSTRVSAPAPGAARFATLDDAGLDSLGESRFDSLEDPPAHSPADAPILPAAIARALRPEMPDASMFAASDEHGAPGRRWVAVAAVAIVIAAGVGGAYSVFGSNARIDAAAGSVAPAAESRMPGNHPIALVSLKHDANVNGAFVVTGLVQNPADGQPLKRVEALVYLFDEQGNYFAMGRAALEFTSLEPGEESPFVIRVPTTARVVRYRVGFRLEGGGAVAHIDKRGQAPATSPESGS